MNTKQTERRQTFVSKYGVTGGTLESRADTPVAESPRQPQAQPRSEQIWANRLAATLRERDIARAQTQSQIRRGEQLADALRIFVAAENWPTKAEIMGARATLALWDKEAK